ncbi:MAG: hypothetical protein D6690_02350 [Nitrospirae bacterium]|nr:MAG: hypothetical protein D6690_02350 [Nitrospirota bacterium]
MDRIQGSPTLDKEEQFMMIGLHAASPSRDEQSHSRTMVDHGLWKIPRPHVFAKILVTPDIFKGKGAGLLSTEARKVLHSKPFPRLIASFPGRCPYYPSIGVRGVAGVNDRPAGKRGDLQMLLRGDRSGRRHW